MKNLSIILIIGSIVLFCYSCSERDIKQNQSEKGIDFKKSEFLPPKIIYLNKSNLSIITPGENGVPPAITVKMAKPTVHLLSDQPVIPGVTSLSQSKEQMDAGQKPKMSKKPTVVQLDKEKLLVCTPGKQGLSLPKVYQVENLKNDDPLTKNYSIQYGDTIYPPVFKTYPATILKSASPPIYKDNANRNIQVIGKNEGLMSAIIWSITEDSCGNIWFGTFGGAVCYDGTSYRTFTVNEGLNDNWVSSIYEDKHGRLWFSHQMSNAGVSCYDGQQFCHFTTAQGLSGNQVNSVLEDKKGNIWFGTDNGLTCFTGTSFFNYTDKQGLCYNMVFDLFEDDKGLLWIATQGGISIFDGRKFLDLTVKNGFFKANSIVQDKNGSLWFAAHGLGLIKFDGKSSFTHYTEEQGLSSNKILMNNLLADKKGNIWVGTENGLNCFDGESFTHFTTENGLSNNIIGALCEDSGENIWIGTRGNGVNCYATHSFIHFTKSEGLPLSTVRAIAEDQSGKIWIGTWGGGVSCYDGISLTNYDLSAALKGAGHNDIRSIIEDEKGHLWFGTGNGLDCFDGEHLMHYGTAQGLPDDGIAHLYKDRKNNIWIGTWEGGLSCWDGKSFTNYNSIEEIGNFYVSPTYEDENGNLWITTLDKGISCYDGEKILHYSSEQGLPGQGAFGLVKTADGGLLAGTYGHGLTFLLEKSIYNYSSQNGLSADNIMAIQLDMNKNIWVATDEGLNFLKSNLFSKDLLSKWNSSDECAGMTYSFKVPDGLKSPGIYQHALCIDSKNRLWIGTNDALSMLELDQFRIPESIPKVQLNSIDIQNNPVDFYLYKQNKNSTELEDSVDINLSNRLEFDSVARFFNYPYGLKLPYQLNHVTFHFSGIDWAAPHKIVYQYKLEGLEKNWSQSELKNFADYRNIPYGNYIFKIKAKGSSGKWSEIFEYPFKIKPPWWHTWWARLVYGIILLFMIYGIVMWRTTALNRRKNELLLEVDNATKEIKGKNEELRSTLEQLKQTQSELIQSEKMASLGQLIAGIAHEINTPLGAINSSIVTIEENTRQSYKLLPELFQKMPETLMDNFIQLLTQSFAVTEQYSSIEERQFKKSITKQLEDLELKNPDLLADTLVDLGICNDVLPFMPLLQSEHVELILNSAYCLSIQHKNSRNIKTAVEKASKILFALKSYSRYSSSESKVNANIIEGIDTVLTLYHNQLKHGIEVIKKFDEIPEIACYPDELNQVWTNLIHNSIYAMQEKGKLEIAVFKEDNAVVVKIKDNGKGIPDEIKDKVFDAFFTTKPTGEGSGLGLNIVKKIVEKHNGIIDFKSEPGKGTEFRVMLPIS